MGSARNEPATTRVETVLIGDHRCAPKTQWTFDLAYLASEALEHTKRPLPLPQLCEISNPLQPLASSQKFGSTQKTAPST